MIVTDVFHGGDYVAGQLSRVPPNRFRIYGYDLSVQPVNGKARKCVCAPDAVGDGRGTIFIHVGQGSVISDTCM